MHKALSFFMFCLLSVIPQTTKAQEFQGVRANPDPLEERMKIDIAYIPNYRELMRDMVVAFSEYVKNVRPEFYIVTQGGSDLLTRGQWENDLDELHRAEMAGAKTDDEKFLLKLFSPEEPITPGTPNRRYLQAINAFLTVNQYCGKSQLSKENIKVLDDFGILRLSIEHCPNAKKMQEAQIATAKMEIPIYVDTDKNPKYDTLVLEDKLFLENQNNITSLKDVRNILVMTNTLKYTTKDEWIDALSKTNYDLLIIDPFFRFNQPLTKEDVTRLKYKKIGARRLVFAILNITSAEDTRPYWEKSWKLKSPPWLRFDSKTNPAATIVDYWNPAWKRIMGVYFKGIMDLGFDGVVLQGLDEHRTYERIIPIS